MKTAFLIITHDQPEHLKKLVNSLFADWADFYIHVDLKQDDAGYKNELLDSRNCTFLSECQRYDVHPHAFSFVEATLALLSAAFESGQAYERFCLLSGSDFPVKSLDEIATAFSGKTEYISIDRCIDKAEPASDISLYQGASWWSLTYNSIGFIIDFLESHPLYMEFHRQSVYPASTFFHSIIKSSDLSSAISHDFETAEDIRSYGLKDVHGCHYINLNFIRGPVPKVLGAGDARVLIHSGSLFGRKFRTGQSDRLIELLEQVNHQAVHEDKQLPGSHEGVLEQNEIQTRTWVLGEGRSGTTWLAELINSDGQSQYIFEPLHPLHQREMADYEMFSYRNPSSTDNDLERYAEKIFSGYMSAATYMNQSPESLIYPEHILVKDIFSHMLAKWVLKRINGIKVLVILRHPFAVALSKMKFSRNSWKSDARSFLKQEPLSVDYLQPYVQFIRSVGSDFEHYVMIWSIVHFVMFQQLNEDDYELVYYENLCKSPEPEIKRIMNYLGKDQHAIDCALERIDKASGVSSEKELKLRGRKNTSSWREQLTDSEYDKGMKILRAFNLDGLYDEVFNPVDTGVSDFLSNLGNKRSTNPVPLPGSE